MDYYHGRYSSIQVTADSGKTIRFSAHYLRPFISSLGIRGRFRLILSNENNTSSQYTFLQELKIDILNALIHLLYPTFPKWRLILFH